MQPTMPSTNPLLAGVLEESFLKDVEAKLTEVVKQHIDKEADVEKQAKLFRLQQTDLYLKGRQNIYPAFNREYGSPNWQPLAQNNSLEAAINDYNFDLVQSFGNKYQAVMGSRPFGNVKAEPKRPQKPEDRDAARMATAACRYLGNKWSMQNLLYRYFGLQYDSGEVYGYVTVESDAAMFGTHEEPAYVEEIGVVQPAQYVCSTCNAQFEKPDTVEEIMDDYSVQPVNKCPYCHATVTEADFQPAQEGTMLKPGPMVKYALPGPKAHLLSGAFVTVAPDCTNFATTPYLIYEYEEHKGVLLKRYGKKLRDKINSDGSLKNGISATRQSAQQTRAMLLSINASPRVNHTDRWPHTRIWMNPSMFEYIEKEEIREYLKQQYPRGIKITMVDGVVMEYAHEAHTDCWTVGLPKPGHTVHQDPLAYKILPLQDAYNDFWNLVIGILEKLLPTYAFDSSIISRTALRDRSFQPGDGIEALPGAPGRLDKAIVKFPEAHYPDQAVQVQGGIKAQVEDVLGMLPNVYGGANVKDQTAQAAQSQLNQALQQLSVAGAGCQQFICNLMQIAIKMWADALPVNVEVPGAGGAADTTELIDPEVLRNGQYNIVGNTGIPMSFAERKDAIMSIITQNPEVAQVLRLTAPENASVLRDYVLTGMDELKIPDDSAWQNTLETIQILAEQQPQEMNGQLMPSVQPEEFVVDPAAEADRVQVWLNETAGRELKKNNLAGYKNVVAYGMLCRQLGMPPMPPPDPNGAPPQGGPPPINPPQPEPPVQQ